MRRSGLDPGEIGAVFVSHLHGDHFGVGGTGGAGGTVIAYTGDTAWTAAITRASHQADLLIAEAYHWDKPVPHHLRYADLVAHEITARRVILTHMSADMLARQPPAAYEAAHDGLVITV